MSNYCLIGERGLVSQALRKKLEAEGHTVSVLSTDTAVSDKQLAGREEVMAADVVVMATQDFTSDKVVENLGDASRILDISPAFRLHPDWVYGLPELPGQTQRIQEARRVANPGCMATAALLLLSPLTRGETPVLQAGAPLYLDVVTGYTAGGQKWVDRAKDNSLRAETVVSLDEEHRHVPEIKHFAGISGPLWLTPKIAAFPTGMRMQIPLFGVSRDEALGCLEKAYNSHPMIVVGEDAYSRIPGDEWAGLGGAHLSVSPQKDGCVAVCLMDNLGKGAIHSARDNLMLMMSKP
jgi:N-acetyl-gamma-glutamyl-phosphate reductase